MNADCVSELDVLISLEEEKEEEEEVAEEEEEKEELCLSDRLLSLLSNTAAVDDDVDDSAAVVASVGGAALLLSANSLSELSRVSLLGLWWAWLFNLEGGLLKAEWTVSRELDSREKEEVDREEFETRLQFFCSSTGMQRAWSSIAKRRRRMEFASMSTVSGVVVGPGRFSIDVKGFGVEERKDGETRGEAWWDEDEDESIEQERFVSNPESTEFFRSTSDCVLVRRRADTFKFLSPFPSSSSSLTSCPGLILCGLLEAVVGFFRWAAVDARLDSDLDARGAGCGASCPSLAYSSDR